MYRLPDISICSDKINEIVYKELPVMVFGNGMLGKAVVDLLLDMKVKIINICDNNPQITGKKYKGIEIINPTQIKDKNISMIVAVYEYLEEITSQLNSMGIYDVLPYYCCFRGQMVDREFYWNNDASIQDAMYLQKKNLQSHKENFIAIDSLDIAITEKCSLKCKNCANLIQYYQKPQNEDFNKAALAMQRMFQCVDLIGRVSILGGEPLVSRDVSKYVEACSRYDNIVNILVVTNGTIVPNDELISAIKKDERCILSVSDYGALSAYKEDIINLSEEKKFKIAISRRAVGIWRELGKIEYVNLSDNDTREKFSQCMTKKFLSIKDGKLFVCPFVANAYALKAIAKEDVDYIDLLDESITLDVLREKICEFIKRDVRNECKYCIEKGKKAKLIPAAQQVETPISYNKYTY